jgi:hypothetical protein
MVNITFGCRRLWTPRVLQTGDYNHNPDRLRSRSPVGTGFGTATFKIERGSPGDVMAFQNPCDFVNRLLETADIPNGSRISMNASMPTGSALVGLN